MMSLITPHHYAITSSFCYPPVLIDTAKLQVWNTWTLVHAIPAVQIEVYINILFSIADLRNITTTSEMQLLCPNYLRA